MKGLVLKTISILLIFQSNIINTAFADFNDIASSPAKESILALEDLNIIQGYTDGSFRPGDMITRAEFVTLAAVTAGLKNPVGSQSSYADIPADHWAAAYINYCDDKGWLYDSEEYIYFVDLDEDGNEVGITPIERIEETARYHRLHRDPNSITELFEPNKNISLEDAVEIVIKMLGYEPYAERIGYMPAADGIGLLEDLETDGEITREEAARLIYKALHTPMLFLKEPDPDAEHGAYEAVIADGTNGKEYITLYTTFFGG